MNDNRHEKSWNDPPLFSLDQMTRATNPTVINRRNRYPPQMATNTMNSQISTNPQMVTNAAPNQPSFGHYSQQQTNSVINQSMDNFETPFDVNTFVYWIQMTISSVNHLPQELIQKWLNIQNYIYGIPIESQTKVYFQSILTSLQSKDFNNCRLYSSYLTNDSNETIRTIALILNQIFSYFQ